MIQVVEEGDMFFTAQVPRAYLGHFDFAQEILFISVLQRAESAVKGVSLSKLSDCEEYPEYVRITVDWEEHEHVG